MAIVQVTYHRISARTYEARVPGLGHIDLSCPCGWHEKVSEANKRDVESISNRHMRFAQIAEILPPGDPRSRRELRMMLAPSQRPWRS